MIILSFNKSPVSASITKKCDPPEIPNVVAKKIVSTERSFAKIDAPISLVSPELGTFLTMNEWMKSYPIRSC